MAPAASTAVEPSGIGQARTSSGPAVRNETSPSSLYDSAMTRSRPDSAMPKLLHEDGGLVGLELAELHLDLRGQGVDHGVAMRVARRDAGDELGRPGEVALADVEQHEDGLLGQEPEAADRLLLVGVELEVTDRRAGLEPGMDALQDDLLALVRLALGAACRAGRSSCSRSSRRSAIERSASRNSRSSRSMSRAGIDAAFGMRVRRILERPDDVEERVRVAESGEVVGRQLLGPDVALRRGRRRRQVDVGDVGLDDLLGLEDLGQPVEAVVGDLDDADVEGDPAVAAGLGVAAGERVEDGRLARAGKPDDGDLHAAQAYGRSTEPRQ